MSEAMVILCTCPDEGTASRLARGLVEAQLAACVNILPGIRSIYRWQGAVSDDSEVLMVIKSLASRLDDLEAWLLEHHPYDVPEVVALPAEKVSADYLAWIEANVGKA
jgi:periplasmic divalent cation tolerance protein